MPPAISKNNPLLLQCIDIHPPFEVKVQLCRFPSFKDIHWYDGTFPIIFLRSSSSLTFITRLDILLNIRSHALSHITLINLLSYCFRTLMCRCWIIMKHTKNPRKFIARYKSLFLHINMITLFSKLTCPFFVCFIRLFWQLSVE